MTKKTMYPTSITQPNKNESSGLAGVPFKEIRRDGKIHIEKLRDLKDPKYFHEWKNTSNLKNGGTINCGNRSSYHCSHKTYYGIKGYRNTCPIAGVTGTYTQPAKLRLGFSPSKKRISSTATIKSVTLTFKHRCVGVDVANDKIYTSWGPNFSGFKHYPDRQVITVKFAGQTQYWNKNPPLSETKYDTVSLKFKSTSKDKIRYSELNKGYMDIQYGNNLSTNPGNIYIKDLEIEVEYEEGKIYLEGEQSSDTMYLSNCDDCKSSIIFTLEAGYKEKGSKINPSKAPKILQNAELTPTLPFALTSEQKAKYFKITKPNDNKTIKIEIKDPTLIEGNKKVDFKLEGVGEISFDYEAIKRPKPSITIPSSIEKNTKSKGVTSIIAKNGCVCTIKAYDNEYKDSATPIYTFNNLKQNNNINMIPQNDVDEFYKVLSQLSCGVHTIIFKRGDESLNEMVSCDIEVKPTEYNIKFYKIEEEKEIEIPGEITVDQNKQENTPIIVKYDPRLDVITPPKFNINNPTYLIKDNSIKRDGVIEFDTSENIDKSISIGTYVPGDYVISVDSIDNCILKKTNLVVHINPKHKQHFDEIFVRGEDSTAFDYDYLVALEGDSILRPIKISNIRLKDSYKDLKICAPKIINSNISKPDEIPIKIKNTSNKTLENVFLELNVLSKNEDDEFEVSTDEWINEDGAFYNFEQRFNEYNKDLSNIVSIKNLTKDEDEIEEEDVLIHIKKISPSDTIDLSIPFFSFIEKEFSLQILLFEEPIALYNIEDCTNDQDVFNKIDVGIYDAILTDMSISGNIDIFTPEVDCPLECFNVNGVIYKIKNIDTSNLPGGTVIIRNDPRLKPYKIEDKKGNELDLDLLLDYGEKTRELNVYGTKVTNTIKFPNYKDIVLKGYTDPEGYVTFYITIPKVISKKYSVNELKNICTINIEESNSLFKVIPDAVQYSPGQTIPFKIKVTLQETYFENKIEFNPNITYPGDYDQLKVYYKVCNLKNNSEIFKTTFETDKNSHKLIQNKVEEDILCGVPTDLEVKSTLNKVIVEQTQYNRLSLVVKNKNRFNKDIEIKITELEDVLKYSYFGHDIEAGNLIIDEDKIIWNIDYMEKDSSINGYIDFRGDILGFSNIKVSSKDFVSDIEFNKENCRCRQQIDIYLDIKQEDYTDWEE